MDPEDINITVRPNMRERIPPIKIVQGITFKGKNWSSKTNMIAKMEDTKKLLHSAS